MSWRYTPFVVPLLIAGTLSAGLAAYGFRHRRAAPGASPFALLMAAVAFWSFGNAVQLLGADLPAKLLWARIQYVGILVVPLAWLAFALEYTGREHWITPRTVALASVVPVLTLLIVWTTEGSGLFWADLRVVDAGPFMIMEVTRGPWFWVNTIYCYALLLLGAGLMVPRVLASADVYRWQAASLLVGLAAPWLTNAVFVLSPRPLRLDPTPFAMTIAGVAFAWGLFRFRLFQILPVARDAVIEGMLDGMMVLDDAGRIVDLNPAAQRILGLPASRAVGRPATRLLRGLPDLVERFRDVAEGQTEITVGEGDGVRHYDLRLSRLADRRGRPRGRLVVWRDITARRRAEAGLADQKRLVENLLAVARATTERPTLDATLQNTLDVASSLTGAEGASLFVLDESENVRRSLVAQGDGRVIDDYDMLGPVMEKGLAGWVVRHREPALVRDAQSDERWLALSSPVETFTTRSALCVPIARGTALVGVLTLVHSQPDYFTSAHVAFIQAAADQMALAVLNAQIFDERWQIADRQTTLYEVLKAVGGELDPDAVARAAVRAIGQRTSWQNVVVAVPTSDGAHWKIEATASELSRVGQQPISRGVVGRTFTTGRTQVVPDVTVDPDYVPGSPKIRSEVAVPLRRGERKLGVLNLESERGSAFSPDDVVLAESLADAVALALDHARLYRALADEHRRLQDLEKMRDELTHTMVHDLRNPLTSVAGVLEMLDDHAAGALAPTHREMLKLARHSAERMGELVDAILDVSRLESGSMPVERDRVSVAPLVEETLDLQTPLAGDKGVRLEADVPATSPPLWADPRLVGRVLQNLVGNAVKFTPEGGRIRVRAAVQPSEPGMVVIEVSDTGPGIPDAVQPRLFQKFVTGGQGRGSGLGLAFCRLAVEAQGGRIWAESIPGRGATFTFTVPVAA